MTRLIKKMLSWIFHEYESCKYDISYGRTKKFYFNFNDEEDITSYSFQIFHKKNMIRISWNTS